MKNTKKALLTSALCLLLCCSMLIGTTFAWFTDTVTTNKNVITGGNLDIELYYKVEGMSDWAEVDGNTNVFMDGALWEPGHTEVVKLKVVNAGALALQYHLGVNVYHEETGTNVHGDEFKLSNYIKFGVVDGEQTYDRDQAVAAVNATASALNRAYDKADVLLETGKEHVVTMVVYMPETVGNEANYKTGTAAPKIYLGINLFATQQVKEEDSFGPDYDAEAPLCNFVVTNEAELKEALANAKSGNVIGIKGNVEWTTGAGIGSTPFALAGVTRSAVNQSLSHIAFVGIGEDATFTAIGAGVGAIGIDNGTVIFKNLKIADKSESYAENSWEYGYLEFRGNTVFENCEIVNAIMMEGDSAIFKNCSFNSNHDNEYAVWVSNGDASFENCYITGARGIKIHEAYGSEVGSVVINNNTIVDLTKKPALAIGTVNAKTAIALTNNTIAGTQAGDQGLYAYETDTDVTTFDFVEENNAVYPNTASKTDELKNSLTDGADTVYLTAGTYTFPASDLSKDDVIVCAPGTVFEGKTGLNINGATVVGATFTNDNAYLVNSTTINGTFKDCVFTNSDGLRYCYAGETVVFENCVFDTDFYGIHFDGGANDVVFKNCTFSGFNTFGGAITKLTLENCTFKYNGKGGYNGINLWGDADLINCTFVFDGSASYEWVDLVNNNKTVTFTNCVVTDGTNETPIESVVGDYGTGNTIIVDGLAQ